MVWVVLSGGHNARGDTPNSTPGASPGVALFFMQRRRGREPGADADSGPSFAALPLILDDGLLRRDFARRSFFRVGVYTAWVELSEFLF